MKNKLLFSSFVSIILCFSLICGATFALFTSESKVNVAVTSGTVKVEAYLKEQPKLSSTLGENLPQTTAVYDQTTNSMKITNMVPGDVVDFTIDVYNKSDVTIKYQAFMKTVDNGLFNGLVVKVGTETLAGTDEIELDWEKLAPATDANPFMSMPIQISMPEDTGNDFQTKSIEFTFGIRAVQGNAYTGPVANITTFAPADLPDANDTNEVRLLDASMNFGNVDWIDPPANVEVESAWTFATTETEDQAALSQYADWYCDFVVSCDGDVAKGELGLIGQYDSFSSMWFGFVNPEAVAANTKVPLLMGVAGMAFSYETICTDVKVFDCGVFKGHGTNPMQGKTITVSLCLFDNEYIDAGNSVLDCNEDDGTLIVVNTTEYKFN